MELASSLLAIALRPTGKLSSKNKSKLLTVKLVRKKSMAPPKNQPQALPSFDAVLLAETLG